MRKTFHCLYNEDMNKEKFRWLLSEIPALVKDKAISEESAKSLESYCRQKISVPAHHVTAQQEKRTGRNPVPVILSIAAALLISGGIISLVAYNWAAISRGAKITVAVCLLLGLQAFSLWSFSRPSFKNTHFREGISVLWAILFGGITAFISQTLRLPSETASFIALWAFSSTLILYATSSYSVFFLALILDCAFVAASKSAAAPCVLFYVLLGSLISFASSKKNPVCFYAVIICSVIMLGPVLDKSVPGLWIVCYTSLFALCAYSKRKPLHYASLIAFSVFAVVLSWPGFWKDIGPEYLRSARKYSTVGCITDIILTLFLLISSIVYPVILAVKKKPWKKEALIALAPLLTSVLYLFHSFHVHTDGEPFFAGLILSLALYAGFFIAAKESKIKWLFVISPLLVLLQSAIADFQILWQTLPVAILFTTGCACHFRSKDGLNKELLTNTARIASAFTMILALCYQASNQKVPSFSLAEWIFIIISTIPCLALIFRSGSENILKNIDIVILCATIFISEMIPYPSSFMLLQIISCLASIYSMILRKKNPSSTAYLATAITGMLTLGLKDNSVVPFAISTFILILHLLGNLSEKKAAGKILLIISAISGGLMLLLCSYPDILDYDGMRTSFSMESAMLGIYTAVFAIFCVYCTARCVLQKQIPNPTLITMFLIFLALLWFTGPLSEKTLDAMGSVFFILSIIFALYHLFNAYRSSSIAATNTATVFLGLVIAIRFFSEGYGLVAKGLLFIALGILILVFNLLILRRSKNGK